MSQSIVPHAPAARTGWIQRFHHILNHDFCPGANRWVYWLKQPLACLLIGALAALIFAIHVEPRALVAGGVMLLVAALGVCWPWLSLIGVRAEMEFQEARGREGNPTDVRLKIVNRCPWPVWGLSVAQGKSEDGQDRPTIALARIPALATTEFSWKFTPECRGVYPRETPLLMTGFPFGLWYKRQPVAVLSQLLVWPRTFALDTLPDAACTEQAEEHLSDRRVGDCGDMLGTRLFRHGDALRRVHWAQSARHGKLIVCERQGAAKSTVQVAVDVASDVHAGSGGDSSLEWSIRIAASVCQCLHANHAQVECCIGSERIAVEPGTAGLRRLFDSFARIPKNGKAAADFATSPSTRCRTKELQIVCTTDVGWARSEPLQKRPERKYIVLNVDAFRNAPRSMCSLQATSSVLSERNAWVQINEAGEIPQQFNLGWKRACRAG